MTKYSDSEIRRMIHQYQIEENLLNEDNPEEYEHYKDIAIGCYYSVIEGYVPDCPGWVGDVLTVMQGIVTGVENFMIEDGRLVRIKTVHEAPDEELDNLMKEYGLSKKANSGIKRLKVW